MNHNVTQSAQGPLARIGRRIAAIVAECNYAQTRVTSSEEHPGAVLTRELAPGAGPDPDPDPGPPRTNQPLAGRADARSASVYFRTVSPTLPAMPNAYTGI